MRSPGSTGLDPWGRLSRVPPATPLEASARATHPRCKVAGSDHLRTNPQALLRQKGYGMAELVCNDFRDADAYSDYRVVLRELCHHGRSYIKPMSKHANLAEV